VIALDVRLFQWIQATFSEGGWLALMCVLTVIGGGWGSLLIVPLYASPKTRRFATSLTAVIVANALVVFVLKAVLQRRRPYLVVAGAHARVFAPPTDFSLPSGHAAGSFAFASFLAVVLVTHAVREPANRKRRVLLAAVAVVAAVGVATSRCALGVHFPADVLLGALLGATLGAVGARWHLRRAA
jgi:undecaprenyl-diphosphatase